MDDIYAYIKLDHQKVDKLFELYETATTQKNKLEIVAMLNKELTVHATSEEETLYQILEKHRQSRDEAFHGEKEHQHIKDKLAEITQLSEADSSLDNKVQELKELVKHHVAEEEGNIFREAKDIISPEHAYILKEQMHYIKGKLLLANFPG